MTKASLIWLYGDRSDASVLCIPGVLQHGNSQFEPIWPVLGRAGSVFGIDYGDERFDPDGVQALVREFVREEDSRGKRVTVFAASLGGMQIPWAISGFDDELVQYYVRWLISDAPFGIRSMAYVPECAAEIVAPLLRVKPPLWLNRVVGRQLMDAMVVPPKPENIYVPDGVQDPEQYRLELAEKGRQDLLGHSVTMMLSQLAWMAGVGSSRMPFGALSGLDVRYIECTGGVTGPNETVRQPYARRIWQQYVPGLKVDSVPTMHCGFLEQPLEWERVLMRHLPI